MSSIDNPSKSGGGSPLMAVKIMDEEAFESKFNHLNKSLVDHSYLIMNKINAEEATTNSLNSASHLMEKMKKMHEEHKDKLNKLIDGLKSHHADMEKTEQTSAAVHAHLSINKDLLAGMSSRLTDHHAELKEHREVMLGVSAHMSSDNKENREASNKHCQELSANSVLLAKSHEHIKEHFKSLSAHGDTVRDLSGSVNEHKNHLSIVKKSLDSCHSELSSKSGDVQEMLSSMKEHHSHLMDICSKLAESNKMLADRHLDLVGRHESLMKKHEDSHTRSTLILDELDKVAKEHKASLKEMKERLEHIPRAL